MWNLIRPTWNRLQDLCVCPCVDVLCACVSVYLYDCAHAVEASRLGTMSASVVSRHDNFDTTVNLQPVCLCECVCAHESLFSCVCHASSSACPVSFGP